MKSSDSQLFVPLDGWNGYHISITGQVLGKNGSPLKPVLNGGKYPAVTLVGGGKTRRFHVARLMVETFRPEWLDRKIRYVDGDTTNVSLQNLQVASVVGDSWDSVASTDFDPNASKVFPMGGYVRCESLPGFWVNKYGLLVSPAERSLLPSYDQNGEAVIRVSNRSSLTVFVKNLVYAAFVGPLSPGRVVVMKDGDPANLFVENLVLAFRTRDGVVLSDAYVLRFAFLRFTLTPAQLEERLGIPAHVQPGIAWENCPDLVDKFNSLAEKVFSVSCDRRAALLDELLPQADLL